MSVNQLLQSMCTDLSDADLNAIRKTRGFSLNETASRTSFASFYISSIGLESAMQALTPEESISLKRVHEIGEVDVSFFDRIYASGYPYGTFSQRYKSTFDSVKKNLVRRGLLVMAEINLRNNHPQMERWRFAIPDEFIPYLPVLPSKSNASKGESSDHALRKKLLELTGGTAYIPKDQFPIQIKQGTIFLGDSPYNLRNLNRWQSAAWYGILKTSKPGVPTSLDPTQAVFNLLNTRTWISAQELEPALKIYCFGGPPIVTEKLLNTGWELGLLYRQKIDSVYHYQLPTLKDHTTSTTMYPDSPGWLNTTSKPGAVQIDLRLIPLHDLELFNIFADFEISDGMLFASPSLLKLGRAEPATRNSPLLYWLAEKIATFRETLETVNSLWGKTILHENLLVARVRDLSLRIQLERELNNRIIILNEHFIAFPRELRPIVDKVLKKTGFVTKTIHP